MIPGKREEVEVEEEEKEEKVEEDEEGEEAEKEEWESEEADEEDEEEVNIYRYKMRNSQIAVSALRIFTEVIHCRFGS